MGEISVKTGNNARNGGKNSLNRLIRCVCGKKIGPDPRNFNQRVSLGRNDLLIRTFPSGTEGNDEINNIKINLSNILIDSLDDAKVNLEKVIDSILKTFLKLPYINDVKILEWCFNQSMQYSDDTTKIKHARSVIDHIDFNCD
ncbi:TPA: GerMN domain-containing protein [Escherichia coli]|nr:GerMN domain-containing protein [Escherichia coli]